MSRNDNTSAIVDGILKLTVTSSALAAGLLIPNLLIGLEKPLEKFWQHMDKRERERELRRVLSYMKTNQLIRDDYKHGLQITDKGRKRLEKTNFDKLAIEPSQKWDQTWRLIIYDIPDTRKASRNALTAKLNRLGFYQLQRSAWLHPFSCRQVIEGVASHLQIDEYISYIETFAIDNQTVLIKKFKKKYPFTNF